MSDIVTTGMDEDWDLTPTSVDAVAITGEGGDVMSYLHVPPYTQTEVDKLLQPGFVKWLAPSEYTFDTTPALCASTLYHGMDVDSDYSPSAVSNNIIIGAIGDVMTILLNRPIRNRLDELVYPGLIADMTKAQFVEIPDIRATGMDVDFDLPCGASGAWGALEMKGEIAQGTIHWSFDDFTNELKTQSTTKVEYISGAGIPPYTVLGADDPDSGTLNRDMEDFRFYSVNPIVLRYTQLALPDQWNEINLDLDPGTAGSLKPLTAVLI